MPTNTPEYMREYRSRNPGAGRRSPRAELNAKLRYVHGLSLVDYEAMEEEQGGVCAICLRPPDRNRLYVDHDHETGAIRGLLCNACNSGLGMLGDDPLRVKAALEYLLAH